MGTRARGAPLQLEANARTLPVRVATFFRDARATGFAGVPHRPVGTVGDGHGRHEVRGVWAVAERSWLGVADDWPKRRSAVCVERTRTVYGRTGVEGHLVLGRLQARSAVTFAAAVRGHWTVENQLHWRLGVQMRGDASRIRDRSAAQNFAALRRGALSPLEQGTSSEHSLRRKQAPRRHRSGVPRLDPCRWNDVRIHAFALVNQARHSV